MRILIIRFSSIGDIVATTALPRVIRKKISGARIDYLTSIEFRELLAENPHIDNVLILNRKYARFRELLGLAYRIKKQKYDLIIDAHNTIRSRIITFVNKNTPFVRYDKHRVKRFLLSHFKINLLKNIPLNVKRHGNALSSLGINYDDKGTELFLSKKIQAKAKELITQINGKFVVLVSGAAWKGKQWSKEKFINLSKDINKLGYKVVFLGAEKDKITETDEKQGLYNFCGKLSLLESIAFMKGASLVVGNDTGLLHSAEAIGKDIVLILGPTGKEYGMYPIRENSQTVELDLWCRPCSSYGSKACIRFTRACLRDISVDMVFDKVKKGLNLDA